MEMRRKVLLSHFDTRAQIVLLALLALYFLVWPVWRAQFPIEIAENEGWNAYQADAAMGARTLYPPSDALIVNNYPPLSFYALGWLGKIFGDPLYVGRVLSLLSTVGLGALIARVVLQLGSGGAGAAIAGLWFVATMARSYNRFVGMDDPQLTAQLIMLAALSWFLARSKGGKSPEPPILLMALAGFWKHNVVAIPATTIAWLWLRDGWRAWRASAVGAAAAVLGLVICMAIYGDAFLANLLTPRPWRIMRAVGGIGRAQWIIPALAIWALWAWSERRTFAARFTALYIGIASAALVVQWGGEDILDNAQFDLVIATAVGLGVAFDRIGATGFARRYGIAAARASVVLILALRLLATLRIEPFLILFDPAYRAEFYVHAQAARDDAVRVAAIPGAVACTVKIVCRMAGKPYVWDDFRTDMLIYSGAAKGLDAVGLIRQHGYTYYENDARADIRSLHRALIGPP
jgi:hypothetical protein